MKILQVMPHMGGGIGTVLLGWMGKIAAANDHDHTFVSLDTVNEKAQREADRLGIRISARAIDYTEWVNPLMADADIVLCHYWHHNMLVKLFARPIPDCRLAFWAHANVPYSAAEIQYPDRFFDTSPVQGHGAHIWSTGDMSRFLAIEPKEHSGFNIGTVLSPKLRPDFLDMCGKIKQSIPDVHFILIGDASQQMLLSLFQPPPLHEPPLSSHLFTWTGKVDDTAPYLAELDVFGYPLRPDHYGTCEQALGEAMAAGVVPVIMKNEAERLCVSDTGFICNSPQHYVDTFKYLNDNRGRFAAECRRHAANLYSIDRMIDSWHLVFEDMLKEPKRKRGVLS